jgi:arylsulfatase A-like enzyme
MKMLKVCTLWLFCAILTANAFAADRPNIVIILADDQGYGDASYHEHPDDINTPQIDRLAAAGVRMTNGYASAYVCAPTRAGLLTGRYQQRFGFYRAGDSRVGLPVSEITIADVLQKEGYATGVFGKWHLGLEPPFYPQARGFDEFYGFLGHGGHDYFDLSYKPDEPHSAIRRNDAILGNETGYLTDNLAREASAFIDSHKDEPFFLYLPFNAVHFPMHAPEEDIKRFNTGDKNRDILLAMLYRMDIGIGRVLDALESAGVADNTLIFYFSDNGGAKNNSANNLPLRDYKHSVYEGGLRVPFVVSWPGTLKPGNNDEPVICLDIFPTICAAGGVDLPGDRVYDGRDMLPALRGESNKPLHDALYWDGYDGPWAMREGDWKLIYTKQKKLELYNLAADLGEKNNLADADPARVKNMERKFHAWRDPLPPSIGKK